MTAAGELLPWAGVAILAGLIVHESVWAFKHRMCKPAHCECSRFA